MGTDENLASTSRSQARSDHNLSNHIDHSEKSTSLFEFQDGTTRSKCVNIGEDQDIAPYTDPIRDPVQDESTSLSAGCSYGPLIPSSDVSSNHPASAGLTNHNNNRRIIWVDFPPASPDKPVFFTNRRKSAITVVATLFTALTSVNPSAYSIGIDSMCRDLGCDQLQYSIGLGVYSFGFAVTPMIVAPFSEDFGRRWTYVIAACLFLLFHVMSALSRNMTAMIIARTLQGCAGSVATTVVGGTIADIYLPSERGLPCAIFAFSAVFGTGVGPVIFAWVESDPKLGWRWIQWIMCILIAALLLLILFTMRETRATTILKDRAHRLRLTRGEIDGGIYTARSEMGHVGFLNAMKRSCTRPFVFLIYEPVVMFFATWLALGWGVVYTMITGLKYIFSKVYGFGTNQVGLVYISILVGTMIGFGANFIQDSIYRRKVSEKGVEARLYASMIAGLLFPIGCYIFSFTSIETVHYIVPCFGIICIIAAVLTIYISAFVYLNECYGIYASSAIAAQGFVRNCFGGAFALFTLDMYDILTPRWTTFTWGCVALLLSPVPFIAFLYGPKIREKSKYSKQLMEEDRARIDRERILDSFG